MSNSGSGDNIISTPKGGGAMSGMGEKFSPDLFTGTGNFSVPIAVPPGRNGFQPELTLGYSTGSGNSPFGLGWGLSVPGIMRKTDKGIPIYDDNKDVFILSGAEDLVAVKKLQESKDDVIHTRYYYRPRTEGLFARIIHHKKSTGENYWEVRSKDGLISYYGNPTVSNDNNTIIADPNNRGHIFGWKLYKTVDPFGNEIIYSYLRDLVKNEKYEYDQLYLQLIKYINYEDGGKTNYLASVQFNYESREDGFSAFKAGFEVRTALRCTNIQTYTHPKEADLPAGYTNDPMGNNILVKTYELNYVDELVANRELDASHLPMNGVSLLHNVTVVGDDNGTKESMPPLEFTYSTFNPQERDFFPITGEQLPTQPLTDPYMDLVDLNGNGLPDLVELRPDYIRYWNNNGDGSFANPRLMKEVPSGADIASEYAQLMDADGDGRADLVINKPGQSGYYSLNHNGQWHSDTFKKYKNSPSFSFKDPEVKLMDLSGNGITDVLRNGSKFECYYQNLTKYGDSLPDYSRQKEGWKYTGSAIKGRDESFPNVSFADPRVRTADMTGDGLQDIVLISSGSVYYWPNLGYGEFGKKRHMGKAPRFPAGFNPKRIITGDLNGDGTADLVYVDNGEVTLWINQSGNGWSDPVTIKGTPVVTDLDDIRITDIKGSGVSGILFSSGLNAKMYFLDFTAGNKPYLLSEMNNNMGAITRVQYTSSSTYFVQDEKAGKKWKTTLPFPVLVVSKVEVIDEVSLGKLQTTYAYHHGYWDGEEREFRGFGFVEQSDSEFFKRYNEHDLSDSDFNTVRQRFYSPPTLTKNWFHLGPVENKPDQKNEYTEVWSTVDFSDEYWQEDPCLLKMRQEELDALYQLPRRARRDVMRAMRGTALRTEMYVLDDSELSDRPFTVSESRNSFRVEFAPEEIELQGIATNFKRPAFGAGSGYVFFSFPVEQRSSQWERGKEPMRTFSFSEDYDKYGQSRMQISAAMPRKQGMPILATCSESEFIYSDKSDQYICDRTKKMTSYEVLNYGGLSAFDLRLGVLDESLQKKVLSLGINYYDGDAYTGLPYGIIGDYGAVVKSQQLVITPEIVEEAYSGPFSDPVTSPPCPPCFNPDSSSWGNYPSDWVNDFQNSDNMLGYEFFDTAPHIEGFYATTEKRKYDFQDNPSGAIHGLVVAVRDPFNNETDVTFDSYNFLPIEVEDAASMTMQAEYDYRIFQADLITDENANRKAFGFSPLGLMKYTAIMGKVDETDDDKKGDTTSNPSVTLEYDFFSWMNEAIPVWVKTEQREHHINDSDDNGRTITSCEYSDGFGRLLQTRTQAEDVLFGNTRAGDSGLTYTTGSNADAVGTERSGSSPLNVVVSGYQVYDNKGRVVEKYEPYFDSGFEYTPPVLSSDTDGLHTAGVHIKMYYDPAGRICKTQNPDGTQLSVIFGKLKNINNPTNFDPTPWVSYTYDANDLGGDTHPIDSASYNYHWNTPKSEEVDALGRVIKTIEHSSHYNGSSYEDVEMRYHYDIEGNLTSVYDPNGRMVFEYKYDILKQKIYTKHIDSGIKRAVFDSMTKPIYLKDENGSEVFNSYDVLNRPIKVWARDDVSQTAALRQHIIYGDSQGNSNNLKGKIYQHYDEAGLTEFTEYDFKGNTLEKSRKFIADSEIQAVFNGPPTNWEVSPFRAQWNGTASTLESKVYLSGMEYDALNRIKKITLPENINTDRKVFTPTYNRAGALESVDYDGNTYVNHIAYNAKGQRLLIAFGNDMMTRYLYDSNNFRLLRQKTEKYIQTDYEFESQSGTIKQDTFYEYDLIGNILKQKERVTDCGISGSTLGSDSLDRAFSYDPLNRLLTATGRQSNTQGSSYLYADAPKLSTYNASNVEAYTRTYRYDKVGNIQSLVQSVNGGFTRNFNYASGKNILEDIEDGSSSNIQSFTYDDNGNMITAGSNRNYVWDYADRMIAYYNQAGTSEPSVYAHYLYDAGGQRVKKVVRNSGGTYDTIVYIDGIFEYRTNATDEQNLVHIMDDQSRIARVRYGDDFGDTSDTTVYNVEDHLGSLTLRLSSTGTVVDREEFYPFGDSSLRTFDKKRYRYTGKEKDAESGLYFYGERFYAAWTCRFISVDPLAGYFPFYTPFNYAGNKPIGKVDIDGMQEENKKPIKKQGDQNIDPDQAKQGNNVIIVVHGSKKLKEAVESSSEQGQWTILYADSFKKAASALSEYVKENGKIDNLVIRSHGTNIGGAITSPKATIEARDLAAYKYFKGDPSSLKSEDDMGMEKWDDDKWNEVNSFLGFSQFVNDEGNVFITACNSVEMGDLDGLGAKIHNDFWDKRFNVYMNQDNSALHYKTIIKTTKDDRSGEQVSDTTLSINPDSTLSLKVEKGWMMFESGIEDPVQLKDGGKTGNVKINTEPNKQPYEIE